MASLAVVFIIKGVQLYFKDGDPRELIYLALIRIGWAVFLLESYDALFNSALWAGFTGEVAPIFGNIQLLSIIYKILLASLGTLSVGSILTGGAIQLVAIPIFLIILPAYAGLLLGGLNAVLTASVYLVSGKLFICLVLFDETQGRFFGRLKGFIGALPGIAGWYFVMGALINFDYWHIVEGHRRTCSCSSRIRKGCRRCRSCSSRRGEGGVRGCRPFQA
ncbi:MAG: hypothetical protein QNK37_34315 [Acidobacteriota bacterium]|nr:hypothetical protein [Acidobacteriota bacterium]